MCNFSFNRFISPHSLATSYVDTRRKISVKLFIRANGIKYEDPIINFRLKFIQLEQELFVIKNQQHMNEELEKFDRKKGQHTILLTQLFQKHETKF